jgi:hypothetical protein
MMAGPWILADLETVPGFAADKQLIVIKSAFGAIDILIAFSS